MEQLLWARVGTGQPETRESQSSEATGVASAEHQTEPLAGTPSPSSPSGPAAPASSSSTAAPIGVSNGAAPTNSPPPTWPPPDPIPPNDVARRHFARPRIWYGWQILINDGIALGLIGTAIETNSTDTAIAGGLMYGFGPLFVHFANGRAGRGFASFGIRTILPLVTAAVFVSAAESGCPRTDACWDRNVAIGLFLGWAGTTALDAGLLAWKPERSTRPIEFEPSSGLRLFPSLSVSGDRPGLSVRLQGAW